MSMRNTQPLNQMAMKSYAGATSDNMEPSVEVPIDETAAIPEVMEQYRDRISALPDDGKTDLVLEMASNYLGPDELEEMLNAIEQEYPAQEEATQSEEAMPMEISEEVTV